MIQLSAGMTVVAVSGSTTNVVLLHRKEVTPTATKALQQRETGVMTSTSMSSTRGNFQLYLIVTPAFANLVARSIFG